MSRFIDVEPVYFDSHKSKYVSGKIVILDIEKITHVSYQSWRSSSGDKHVSYFIHLTGLSVSDDAIRITESEWEDLKPHLPKIRDFRSNK